MDFNVFVLQEKHAGVRNPDAERSLIMLCKLERWLMESSVVQFLQFVLSINPKSQIQPRQTGDIPS